MRCNACGRYVDNNERMYNPTMWIGDKPFAIQRLNAPLICEDCKPIFEKKQNEMRRNGIGFMMFFILIIIGIVLFNWYAHK